MARGPDPAVAERRARVAAAAEVGGTVNEIAHRLGERPADVRNDLKMLGIKAAPGRPPPRPKEPVDAARLRKAERGRAKVRDRRRFKTTMVPGARAPRVAGAAAQREGRTEHGHTVVDPEIGKILCDGANNAKLGGDVLVGRLKGVRIWHLTLEERATCPRSCALWATCYGNGMSQARRLRAGPDLERLLPAEVERVLAAGGGRALVRLHMLGDFYTPDYVGIWKGLLHDHPGLSVFGFTAHAPQTPIGAAVEWARATHGLRFAIRHSGRSGAWGSFTIDFPTDRPRLGDAVVCPEQRDAMNGDPRARHCASCALCWQAPVPIVFVEH